ncbi:hypothetical protein QBA54_26865 [Streptomyces sp. B21-108]|jgi:hypothetical protein|uniref:hypothetical protein n=1 Tax=Streptomyces sp. B21-108 TaxID=3039419 RepID=UPI002FF20464
MTTVTLPDATTERELFSLVKRERLARDVADWDRLEHAYWPDSVVRVTWPVDGVLCDICNWCLFFSRAERRDGEWRLCTFDGIYGKDRLDPVSRDETPHIDAT